MRFFNKSDKNLPLTLASGRPYMGPAKSYFEIEDQEAASKSILFYQSIGVLVRVPESAEETATTTLAPSTTTTAVPEAPHVAPPAPTGTTTASVARTTTAGIP